MKVREKIDYNEPPSKIKTLKKIWLNIYGEREEENLKWSSIKDSKEDNGSVENAVELEFSHMFEDCMNYKAMKAIDNIIAEFNWDDFERLENERAMSFDW